MKHVMYMWELKKTKIENGAGKTEALTEKYIKTVQRKRGCSYLLRMNRV
jgi:hypothetical protein